MIITVTMNPAIDKTVEIDALLPGGLNRIQKVEYDAGGKGINVSKTIKELGGQSIATGFLGGNAGKTIANVLNDLQIQNDFIWVEGETRTNTKVFEKNGAVTELNEPGPVITEKQMDELLLKLERYADAKTLFILAGSIPKGVDKGVYAEITRRVHAKGAKVLMDADGELFRQALPAVPDIIKPNRVELEEYAGIDYRTSDEELLELAKKLMSQGIDTVAVSMGKSGAMMVREGYEVKCPALSVKAHSTVGAGDAMVAALAFAEDNGLDNEETVRLCMAASAGAVTTIGTKPPTRELVDTLMKQVIIEKIG
ncbi:MAG: 1-phosphofructokinase [Bariatricus sp.]